MHDQLQWNLSIAATLGEQHFGRYIEVAVVVLYTNCSFEIWVPGRYTEVAFIQGWPLRGVLLYIRELWYVPAETLCMLI